MGNGGAQQVVLELANGLVKAGVIVELLIFYRTPQDTALIESLNPQIKIFHPGIKITLPSDHRGIFKKIFIFLWLPFWAFYWVLTGKLKQYQIIHSHLALASWLSNFLHLFQSISNQGKAKFIETFHADFASMKVKPLESTLMILLWKHLDAIVLELRRADISYLSKKLPDVKQEYISFGISPANGAAYHDTAIALRKNITHPIILTVSRLHKEKRVEFLIHVISKLKNITEIPFTYLIVGDGPDFQKIKEIVLSLGLDDVVLFSGYLNEVEIPWQEARVFFVAGVEDLVGIAGLRAASFGVPIVSWQIDPNWDHQNSLFWNSFSPEKIAMHIQKLFKNDMFWAKESSRSISVFQEHFSAKSMRRQYLDLYHLTSK